MTRPARWIAALAACAAALPAAAQTDYYNTDAGRPLRVADARPVERHAMELSLVGAQAGGAGDTPAWEIEPSLAYGILPHTHVEIGVPVVLSDVDGSDAGIAGVHVAALHALNVETRTLPALAVGASARMHVGGPAPDATFASVTGLATRTFGWGRVHVNGEYTFGDEASAEEESRWMAGVALDHALPLRALLWSADVFAEQPLDDGAELRWTAEAGLRYQLSPQVVVDGGVGRVLSGGDDEWRATLGASWTFALRSLVAP